MNYEDRACRFSCGDDLLYGILSVPELVQSRGILMLVGGAQYRAGSHRQFTLLSRFFASHGIPVMRFDYRGMGDSEGDTRDFENVNDDIRCAVDYFMGSVADMTGMVMWGLCDAASAALFYGFRDPRISGLALVNPWIRTEAGLAKATLRHYYISRILERALWQKILCARFNYRAAAASLVRQVLTAFGNNGQHPVSASASLPDRMFDGYNRFNGPVLLILSGNDLTAKEFADLAAADERWSALLQERRTRHLELPDANHTFSTRQWRDRVAGQTLDWLRSW
jgi:exosortase A-associated hydrolase 1